jgi:hypothetical protein
MWGSDRGRKLYKVNDEHILTLCIQNKIVGTIKLYTWKCYWDKEIPITKYEAVIKSRM